MHQSYLTSYNSSRMPRVDNNPTKINFNSLRLAIFIKMMVSSTDFTIIWSYQALHNHSNRSMLFIPTAQRCIATRRL